MTSRNVVESAAAAEPCQTSPPATSGSGGGPGRLAWLDVLRGFAALCVVFDHFGSFVPPRIHATVDQWFDPGTYGVFVFFLISGYIVPASLERKGSVRTFWVSRMFRLYRCTCSRSGSRWPCEWPMSAGCGARALIRQPRFCPRC